MSRWRRWWSLWSRSEMKMVKLRASSSQHGQVEHLCPHWIFIFWQNKCSDSGFQMCWIFWGQPWMRTTSLMLHCTTGWKLGSLEQNFKIDVWIFQRGHHTRQLQEESSKVQEQGGCQGLNNVQKPGSSFQTVFSSEKNVFIAIWLWIITQFFFLCI